LNNTETDDTDFFAGEQDGDDDGGQMFIDECENEEEDDFFNQKREEVASEKEHQAIPALDCDKMTAGVTSRGKGNNKAVQKVDPREKELTRQTGKGGKYKPLSETKSDAKEGSFSDGKFFNQKIVEKEDDFFGKEEEEYDEEDFFGDEDEMMEAFADDDDGSV
jgi:hypothetical protein